MTAIHAIFDGKAFVPKEPVSLPAQSEVLVIIQEAPNPTQEQIDADIRAYYAAGPDDEEVEWTKAVQSQLKHAWDGE